MSFDNTNKGTMFKNDRKTQDNHPDYKGSINIDGVEMWASGWIKVAGPNARNPGVKFLSMAFEPKDNGFSKPTPATPPPSPKRPTFDDMDDDVPFSYGVA